MLRMLTYATLMAALLGCLIGCTKQRRTVTTAEGDKATVETDRSGDRTTVTMETDEGEKATVELEGEGDDARMTVTSEEGEGKVEISGDVDLAALGVEVYPGATSEGGSTMEMEGATTRSASLTTSDSFDKVAQFYESKYGEGASAKMSQPGRLMITRDEPTRNVTITVTRDEGETETTIAIVVVPKAK
ncbi:MAG: hypothetical protein PVH68_10505 [Armatimonadota bacterium]|jgi:hypothetical protein